MSPSFRRILKAVFSAAVLTLGLQIAGLILQYVSQLVAAHACGDDAEFGIAGQSRSWVQVLATLAAWGLPTVAVRYIPNHLTHAEFASIGGLLKYGYRRILQTSIVCGVVGGLAVLGLRSADWGGWMLALGMLGIPFCAIHLLQMQATRSLERMAWTYVPYTLFQPILFLLILGVVWWGGWTVHSGWLILAFTLSLLGTSLLQSIPLWKYLPKETWMGQGTPAEIEVWQQVARSLGLSTSAALILRETDVILVGLVADDRSAGIYMAATRIARLCSFALNATASLVGPWVSVRFRQGKMRELEQIVQVSTLLSTVASLFIGGMLVLFAGPLLRMFGPGFEVGVPVVTILLVGHMFNAATGPTGQILGLTGNQKIASQIYLIAAVLHVGGNLVAIHYGGMVGGAIATSVVLSLCNIAMAAAVFRRLRVCVLPVFHAFAKDDPTPAGS